MHEKAKSAHADVKSLIRDIENLSKVRVLVMEDDPDHLMVIRRNLNIELESQKVEVQLVLSGTVAEFIENVKRNRLAALVIDIHLGLENGVDLADDLIKQGLIKCPIVFISGVEPTDETKAKIRHLGATFFHKPILANEWTEIVGHIKDSIR